MVTFERESETPHVDSNDLIQRARMVAGSGPADDVVTKALSYYAAQEAAAFLNSLGGTMPDFRAAPRDRPSE